MSVVAMDPLSSGSYESEKLEPPNRATSRDYQDEYIASQTQQPSTRTDAPVEPEPSTESASWARRVRFNSDAFRRIWPGQAGSENEEQSRSPLTADAVQTQPSTPPNRETLSNNDHTYFYQQVERSTSIKQRATLEDEYLRSLESGTNANTVNKAKPEPNLHQPEVQPDTGYLQSYSEAEELMKFHRSDFTTDTLTADQGQSFLERCDSGIPVYRQGFDFYTLIFLDLSTR